MPLTGAALDRQLIEVLSLALGVLGIVVLRRWPRLAAASYGAVIAFVPVWAGVKVKVFLEPQVLWSLVVLAAVLPLAARRSSRPTAGDVFMALFVLASLAPLLAGRATVSSVFVVAVEWLGAYLVGRLLPEHTGYEWLLRAVSVLFTVVALLAIAEYLSGFNPFLLLPGNGDQYAVWGSIQQRGGVARAEGAFGHSIALGAALSMAIPLTLASSFRLGTRLAMVLAMFTGVVVTFSRIGLICTVIGIVLSLLALREMPTRLRVFLAGSVAVVGVAVLPLVTRVFAAAGNEASKSAAYRGDLLSLVGDMRALGFASSFYRSPDGQVYFGSFRSIDSALMLQGLTYGWVSLGIALVLLAGGVLAVLTRRGTAPTIAVVAQLPALATVALITQYSPLLFFVGGLAVYAQAERRRDRSPADPPPASPSVAGPAPLRRAAALPL